jgi:aminoglycoside phosphotransferase (APT) family kinase protein
VTEVAAGFAAWLRERGAPDAVTLRGRATVGLSQETWFLDVGGRDAVLRLPTAGSGTQAILTQRAALEAVAGRVPAPAVLWHDDGDANPFGRPFLVMERLGGDVPVGWHALPEPERSRLAEQAVDVLAALHAVDPAPVARDGANATDLAFYQRRLARYEPLPPVLRGALWWLERHAPAPAARVFVHGDFRMGNLLVDDGRIAGVLDWEMAGAGDALADLAWCFVAVWEPAGVDEARLAQRYAEAIGRPVDEQLLRWQRVLAYVRLAYYALSGSTAFARGHSGDLRLAALALQLPIHLDRLAATIAGEPVV